MKTNRVARRILEGKVKVWCDNRDELLAIKAGQFSYDELLERSEILIKAIKSANTSLAFSFFIIP